MDITVYQKMYLGFINPSLIIATILPFLCCILVFYLLGEHSKIVWYMSCFFGFLGKRYVNTKLNIEAIPAFVNLVIGLLITPFLLILIEITTRISLT